MKTLGLCMIVKDESEVILRCLESVRPIVDYVLIEDTGSTDGTQAIIRDWLGNVGLSGEVYDEPWRDFAYNRSHVMEKLRQVQHVDYILIIDADDRLTCEKGFDPTAFKTDLGHDLYDIQMRQGGIQFLRPQLCSNKLPFCFKAVLHEYLEPPPGPISRATAKGFYIESGSDGARSRNPRKYQNDAATLEKALLTETDPFLLSRYTFHLAQSYRDCGEREKALENYLKRAELGYCVEEVFESLYSAAKLKEVLEFPTEEVIASYLRAVDVTPTRAEALHRLALFCRLKGRNEEGFQYAKRGLDIPRPAAGPFVERWVYDWGLLDELAVNGYWSGHYRESLNACLHLLEGTALPGNQRERIARNARHSLEKLPTEANLGCLGQSNLLDQHALVAERPLRSRVVGMPKVMLAILAKQKEQMLPLYLECIETLDYPKSSIVLYVRTNNNTDGTERILREWVERVSHVYAAVEFDAEDVADQVQQFDVHEWNSIRFRVLGRIRNVSLRRALEHECDFYFVTDVDNFIRPCTLRELVALNLPIVAPLLRSLEPGRYYSNYHAEVDANGYYRDCDQYQWILNRWIRGIVEVPVVHTTYLIRADVIPDLSYEDVTDRHEYVVFSDNARKSGVPQYLDNRQVYGYVAFDAGSEQHVPGGVERARTLLSEDLETYSGVCLAPLKPTDIRESTSSVKAPRCHATNMRTLVFCTSFARTNDEWNGRYARWVWAIQASQLHFDQILIVDDGSPILPDWADIEIRADDSNVELTQELRKLILYHFRTHLGRKSVFDFPGWYRSFAFAGRYARDLGFEKVIHIESDSFLIGDRIQRHFNDLTGGWTALWCPLYQGYPESAIQVIAGDAIKRFAEIEYTHPHESLIGKEFELQLPFDTIQKKFIGNRYGEYLPFVPRNAEYVVQARSDQPDNYYWWLRHTRSKASL